jgi:translation initiation factor 4E
MWEDEGNRNGGKISVKLKKDYTTIIWEEIILALIGSVLPQTAKDEINGVVVSIRKEFNLLQIWFKTYSPNVIGELE